MPFSKRIGKLARALVYRFGSPNLQRLLWNWDYARGHYGYGTSVGDFLYPLLTKYLNDGNLLDLGCGEGKIANELDATAYSSYTGVDISDLAIDRAIAWSWRTGRLEKNRFYVADLSGFAPTDDFDVILFRDSIYYLPGITEILNRYAAYLTPHGCFIVRFARPYPAIAREIHLHFEEIERRTQDGAEVWVFRPKKGAA